MMTNAGLSICLPVVQTFSYYLAILNAHSQERPPTSGPQSGNFHVNRLPTSNFHMAIPIRGRLEENEEYAADDLQPGIMERMSFPPVPCFIQPMRALLQPKLFIRSRPGALTFDACCARYNSLALPFQFGFLLIFDNIQVLDKPRKDEGMVFWGEAVEAQDEQPLRLKPTPTDHISLTERLTPFERRHSIETFPSGCFDSSRDLVYLDTISNPSSGVLVRLGYHTQDSCVLFLGIKMSPHSHKPLRFCKILSGRNWPGPPDYLAKMLQTQQQKIRGREESHATEVKNGYSVVINEGHDVGPGSLFLTYIHHE